MRSSKWIEHVKKYAAENKMSYRDALKCAKCKAEYEKISKGSGLRAIARKMHGKGGKSSKVAPIESDSISEPDNKAVPEPEPESESEPELSKNLTEKQLRDILSILFYERNNKQMEASSLKTFPNHDKKRVEQLKGEIDFILKQENIIEQKLRQMSGGKIILNDKTPRPILAYK